MPPFLKETQLYHFVEDNKNYNPLFRNQGDSKSPKDMVLYASDPALVDAEILSGVAKGRIVTQLFKSRAMSKVDAREFKPNLSPLAPFAREISIRVHRTLKVSPMAYEKQIEAGLICFESDLESKQQVIAALKCKYVSIPIARETFTMLNRGVSVDRVRAEVTGMVQEACKLLKHPNVTTKNVKRVADIASIGEIQPEVTAKENTMAGNGKSPAVTMDEVCKLCADLKNDPIVHSVARAEKRTFGDAAVLVAIRQVDEVLNTLAIKAILEGEVNQPSPDQLLTSVNQQGGPKPMMPVPAKIPGVLVNETAIGLKRKKKLRVSI